MRIDHEKIQKMFKNTAEWRLLLTRIIMSCISHTSASGKVLPINFL